MAAGRKQQIGLVAGGLALLCVGVVFAQEEITPRVPADESAEIDPITPVNPPESATAPSAAELKEIEWIKSQLGSSYSIATRLDRLTMVDKTSTEQDLPKIVGPDAEAFDASPRTTAATGETRMLRSMAQQLEQSAAELEERGDFVLADQMRQLALSHWRLARVAGSGQSRNSDEAAR